MAEHRNVRVVLSNLREIGIGARVDEDGEIIARVDSNTVVVRVNDAYVYARLIFETSAPTNALAVIARNLHRRLIVGRLVYPDDGGGFVVDYCHGYDKVPTQFDSVHPVATVLDVAKQVGKLAVEYGYDI